MSSPPIHCPPSPTDSTPDITLPPHEFMDDEPSLPSDQLDLNKSSNNRKKESAIDHFIGSRSCELKAVEFDDLDPGGKLGNSSRVEDLLPSMKGKYAMPLLIDEYGINKWLKYLCT